jgi:predicted CoA-binding protein
MTEIANHDALIDEMLTTAKTIAVVGMSNKPERASFNIGNYLSQHGYRVIPVNPVLSEIAVKGQVLVSYPTLEDAQAAVAVEGGKIDLVDVFRASDAVPAHPLSMATRWSRSRGSRG